MMKFLIPLLLASTCLAIPQTDTPSSELNRRIAEPLKARAACHPAIYGTKKICKDHCGRRGKCHKTTAGHPVFWQCKCPGTFATEELSKRVAKPEAEANPVPEEDAIEEELSKRVAEPEAEAAAISDPDSEDDDADGDDDDDDDDADADADILESRADIEARAKCAPGSYGKKKKSCTPHCKGRGKCQRASSPGVGFIWTCNCPA